MKPWVLFMLILATILGAGCSTPRVDNDSRLKDLRRVNFEKLQDLDIAETIVLDWLSQNAHMREMSKKRVIIHVAWPFKRDPPPALLRKLSLDGYTVEPYSAIPVDSSGRIVLYDGVTERFLLQIQPEAAAVSDSSVWRCRTSGASSMNEGELTLKRGSSGWTIIHRKVTGLS